MRKFTKEIAAILASAAFSASMSTVAALSDEPTPTAGVAIDPESITTTMEPLIGTELPRTTTCTTTTSTTHMIGTMTTPGTTTLPESSTLTETTMTHTIGTMVTTPATTISETEPFIETTTTAMIGTEMFMETTTTMMIGTEIPPLMGDVAPADGDVNADGSLDIADVVALEKFLTTAPEETDEEEYEETRPVETESEEPEPDQPVVKNAKMNNWYAADMHMDGKINAKDLTLMRREVLNQNH